MTVDPATDLQPGPTGSRPLPRAPAVALAQALVDHLGRQAGIRTLALKGPVLTYHGLRPRRTSSDADVMVEPGRMPALIARLEACGWRVRFEREMPAIMERHSVTLLHPSWPIDIDVHWYFPGLHADPTVSFEVLWRHRAEISLAGRPVRCLDLAASALVAAAHCVRYPRSPARQQELGYIRDRLADDAASIEAVSALARQTRAVTVLRTLLGELGVDPGPDDLTAAERERWERYIRTHELGSTGAWLHGLASGGPGHRVRTALRALWPARAELDRMIPPPRPRTARNRWRMRTQRWQRGLAAVAPTLRIWRRRTR